ncbi:MAG: FAD-dependent oxidoreductase [Rhodobacteraceae bacterium]|nr:FAD-dependent oxidoreductase [Paracoccaceae bacterium]
MKRVEGLGLIDRRTPLNFSFDGKPYQGFAGDTLASALLANGQRIMGRSFKYHRPRSVWGAWFDDPNAIFDIELNGFHEPNCPAATTYLEEGMQARAVNATPNAHSDIKGLLDKFNRFMPAGFYYKTFMWPNWHLFEGFIRNMAGLGRVENVAKSGYISEQHHATCDVLVIGGGAAGLAAARVAAESGRSVILADDHREFGGGLFRQGGLVEGQTPVDWVTEQLSAVTAAGGLVMPLTTAIGVYDHNLVGLVEAHAFGQAPSLHRIRAEQIIMATGAIDRPVTFANNDRPGIIAVDGALEFLARYGVLVGKNIAILSNNSLATPAAEILRTAGAKVRLLDASTGPFTAHGGKSLNAISQGTERIPCDTILASGGLVPLVHLWRHAGGKLSWRADIAAFVPAKGPVGMQAIGAANGTFDLDVSLSEARGENLPKSTYTLRPIQPDLTAKGRQWIDFQHDVTLKDIELAARENYTSVEHLKRYTTLGMASDQGKTSNMAGLAAMATLQGKSIPETGTTTFRPPFVPVPFEVYRGARRGQYFNPLKRLVLEPELRAAGAAMAEYGGSLRPAWFGSGPHEITREAIMARRAAAIFDASTLGKIEVIGPDAAAFLNFIYYNTMATLKPGFIRYGFMLTERGAVYDDGVVARMGENRFIISCSSSHVDGVVARLEAWRQDGNNPDRVFIHDTTPNWPTVTVTGPKAREILESLDLQIDLAPEAFKHMTWREGRFEGAVARVSRVSFSGDTSFEISVPVATATALWQAALAAGKPLGAGPAGVEALSILRAEKGYLIIGKDTDGDTMPHDLGFSIPRQKKTADFVGDRSLHTENANRADRKQLVGLMAPPGAAALPTGAHLVEVTLGKRRSIGYVTSSYHSPTLGHPIALALIEGGAARMGEDLTVWHMGKQSAAQVTSPCFYDPEGAALHA